MLDCPGYANRRVGGDFSTSPVLPLPMASIHSSTSSSWSKQVYPALATSRMPTRLVCESPWYPYQIPHSPSEYDWRISDTSFIAAVAFCTNTRSKSSGLALKKRRARRRASSILTVERREDLDSECGLPYIFDVMSFVKLSMADVGKRVVPV